MRLRSLILLILFLFGLAPLVAAVAITLPLVMDRLELFYHKAHLQNLRADFRDLDQHLASRHEMVRLLAKLPEASALLGKSQDRSGLTIGMTRAHYTQWINRILHDQLDIIQILFLDQHGRAQFWLARDKDSQELVPDGAPLDMPSRPFFDAGMALTAGGVLISPISVNPELAVSDPKRFMMLRLISPIVAPGSTTEEGQDLIGAVVINIDVGGMARAYRNTYWVHSDGSYLNYGGSQGGAGSAFSDFPGLQEIFAKGDLGLWKGEDDEQVIWVPLFVTERSGPLWVGRRVDPSPIAALRHAVEARVVSIVLILVVIVLLAARWFAVRVERLGLELTVGIAQMLEGDQPVRFVWRGPEELRELAGKLSRLGETYALNSQAMRAHAQELERSNRYKSEFLANVSHELRTPLNSILLLSKMLAENSEGNLTDDQVRQARVINAAGRDLIALIDNILDLSRIEAGKTQVRLQSTELSELLADIIELVHPQYEAKGLTLALEIAHEAITRIVCDPDKLGQILKNFLSNAVKFTQLGGVIVALRRSELEDAAERPVCISVSDTGVGIPADKHAVVFEAFQQADGSTSRRYGGTGLGLTISRELARLLGGRIHLSSAEGRGATFSLLLPLSCEPEQPEPGLLAAPAESPVQARPSTAALADFGGRPVLVVDDDVRHLLSLTPMLESWGLWVTAAGDGEEALETLTGDDRFDLVLMDIMMPGLDGYATIREIRAHESFRELPVIVLSARDSDEARQRCLAAGADAFVSKSADAAQLLEVLSRYLARVRAATPTRDPSS